MANKQVKSEKPKMANIYIPMDTLNPYEETVSVSINGKIKTIARGVSVDVPLEIAEILKNAKYINDFRTL